jgi:hypothetical protein
MPFSLIYSIEEATISEPTAYKVAANVALTFLGGIHVTSSGVEENIATNKGSYFYLKDSIGTVTDVTDSSGMKGRNRGSN